MIFPFDPTNVDAQTFNPILGGQQYTVSVTFNPFSARWYLNIYSISGALQLCTALSSCADQAAINAINWISGETQVTTSQALALPIGSSCTMQVAGVTPDAYNGIRVARVIDETLFGFDLPSNPGSITQAGMYGEVFDLSCGNFPGSSLYYFAQIPAFEVLP